VITRPSSGAAYGIGALFVLAANGCSLLVSHDGLTGPAIADAPDGEAPDGATLDGGTDSGSLDSSGSADRVIPDGAAVSAENGHGYLFVPSPGVTWSQADVAARTMGGHLATITSNAENAFVVGLLGANDRIWIGGRQPAGSIEPAGGWQWVTGEPFNFDAWEPGQPDNYGDEHAIMIFASEAKWHDDEDTNENPGYVAEFE
jgi:hypothetical protein